MKEYPIYETLPPGWKVIQGATNHPKGMIWICNGKSMFSKERQIGLMKKGDQQ